MSEDSNLTARVRKKKMIEFLTCPICKDLFEDPMNITECLHIFCKKCIIDKITEEDLSNCPVCNVDLGCAPLEKLRPDHNWNSIRSVLLPSLRNEDDDYVFVEKEGMELDQIVNVEPEQSEGPSTTVLANVAAAQPEVPSSTTVLANVAAAQSEVPSAPVLDRVLQPEQSEAPSAPMRVRTKGRSPSSMRSTLLESDDDTMRVTRSRSNARKLLFANDHQSSMSPDKLHKSMEDHRPEGLSISKSPLKVAKSNEKACRSKSPLKIVVSNVEKVNRSKSPLKIVASNVEKVNRSKSSFEIVASNSEMVSRSKSPFKIEKSHKKVSRPKSPIKITERNEKANTSRSLIIKFVQRNEKANRSKSPLKIVASNSEKANASMSPHKIAERNEEASTSKSPIMVEETSEKMNLSNYPIKIAETNEKANSSKSIIKVFKRNGKVSSSKSAINIAERSENANRSESPPIKIAKGIDKANTSPTMIAKGNEKVDTPKYPIKDSEGIEKVSPSKTSATIAQGNEKTDTSKSPIKIAQRNEKVSPYPTKIAEGKEKANTSKSPLKIVQRNEEVILSKPPIKIAENNEKNSSASHSSSQKEVTKDKESTESIPLEDMSDMLTPLIYLLEAAADKAKSVKPSADGLVSNATKKGKRKAKDSSNTSKNCDKADDALVGSIPPPPVPAKPKRNRRGRPRKVRPQKEPTIPPQLIIDTARDQLLKRANPIWFTLVASNNQEGDEPLPQLPHRYVSVKDVKLPVVYIKKYLVQKLNLENEDEVEISMWGEPLPPTLHLKTLIELWTYTTPASQRLTARVGESAEDFVMVITYARKAPPKVSTSIPK